jgi:hypothetical protein
MKDDRAQSESFIGMSGLAVALFLYGYSAVAIPSLLHSLLLPLVWLVLFGFGCAWFMTHPRRVVVVAVLAIIVWFAVIRLGPA